MTAAIPVSRQWSREVFYFAYLSLKDTQKIEPLIVDLLEALPIGESFSPRKKRILLWEELEKKLRVELTGKQKPTKGQLELFETNEYRQGFDGKHSIQKMRSQAFLYSKLDLDSMGTGDLLRKQRLPLEWVLEFLSSQPNQNKIPRNQSVPIARYLLGELSDVQAFQVEKEFRLNSDWQKSKIRLEKIIMEMENAFRALNQSFDKDGIEISKKTENSLLMWFGAESGKRSEHIEADAVKKVFDNIHSKSEPKSFSPIKIFFLVGTFASVVGYFGWLEKDTKPFETPLASELSPPVDDAQSIELSPIPFPKSPSVLAEEAANQLLGDRTMNLIQQMENKMKTDPLPEFNTSSQPDFEKP
jgi:hypothetical protein